MSMDALLFWQNTWYFIILAVFAVYTVLDGFDLGVAFLFPFVRKDKKTGDALLASISPFWDGNQVWIIIAVTSLFAAFTPALTVLLSGLFLPILIIIICFVLRAVSFGFLYHGEGSSKMWENMFWVSSVLIAAGLFLALGALLNGLSLNANREIAGSFLALLNPVSIALLAAGCSLLFVHGAGYALNKIDESLHGRFYILMRRAEFIFAAASAICAVLIIAVIPGSAAKPAFIAGALLLLLPLIIKIAAHRKIKRPVHLLLSSLSLIGLWIAAAAMQFPYLIRAKNDLSLSMTIQNSSAALSSLKTLAFIIIPCLIIIACYTAFVYFIFRKRGSR
jgi:cytochrome bd ubiquinol oxidase subunit II